MRPWNKESKERRLRANIPTRYSQSYDDEHHAAAGPGGAIPSSVSLLSASPFERQSWPMHEGDAKRDAKRASAGAYRASMDGFNSNLKVSRSLIAGCTSGLVESSVESILLNTSCLHPLYILLTYHQCDPTYILLPYILFTYCLHIISVILLTSCFHTSCLHPDYNHRVYVILLPYCFHTSSLHLAYNHRVYVILLPYCFHTSCLHPDYNHRVYVILLASCFHTSALHPAYISSSVILLTVIESVLPSLPSCHDLLTPLDCL